MVHAFDRYTVLTRMTARYINFSTQLASSERNICCRSASRSSSAHRSASFHGMNTLCKLLFFAVLFVGFTTNQTLTANTPQESPLATSLNSLEDQDQHATANPVPRALGKEEHRFPQKAVEITRVFGIPVTNSMIVSWMVALGLIIFAQYATRNMKQVPEGAQNFLEWLIEGLYRFLEGIVGSHLAKKTFWFFATIFIFILAANWAGLFPGVGSIGWGHETAHGFKIDEPLFRGANADVNLTFAMSLVFFVLWLVWAFQEVGPIAFLKELFGPKGDIVGLLKPLIVFVFFAAGFLEIISILFRPISLTFRLYGNIFAGENMLETMATMVPGLGWLIQIPFYFLELLMGLVQALVFMLLTAVFVVLNCQHEEAPAATQS